MASKAARLKAKRSIRAASRAGRPPKENVDRYPSGKIKPSETEREVKSVVIEARRRLLGANMNVESPYAGYTLGRIFLDGAIREEHRQAGDEYAESMARYYRLVGVPFPSARAQSLFSIGGHAGETSIEFAARARAASNKMMELERILLCCVDGPQVKQTVFNVCIMDYDHLRGMPKQQMLWLRRGLIALMEHKGLRDSSKSVTTEIA
jgi:hypothetical protein